MDNMLLWFPVLLGILYVVSWWLNKEREKEKMKQIPYPGFKRCGLNSTQWGKLNDDEKRIVWRIIQK